MHAREAATLTGSITAHPEIQDVAKAYRPASVAIWGQFLSLMLPGAPNSLTAQRKPRISHEAATRLLRRDIRTRARTAAFCQLWILARRK